MVANVAPRFADMKGPKPLIVVIKLGPSICTSLSRPSHSVLRCDVMLTGVALCI